MKRMLCAVLTAAMILGLGGCACHRTEKEITTTEMTAPVTDVSSSDSETAPMEEPGTKEASTEESPSESMETEADATTEAPESVAQTTAEMTEEVSTKESSAPTTAETPAETSAAETHIPSSMTLRSVGSLQYYLYTPADPVDNMPLIIYLHGGTNKRADVAALLTTDGFPKYLYEGAFGDLRAYVAVPKLEDSYTGWADISNRIRDMINRIRNACGIDRERIALTGHSLGGTGTWQLQVKLPNTFACIAPLSGSIQNTERNLAALKKTKIWVFVGTADTIVDPASSREIVNALTAAGADTRLTELEGATHFDVPGRAYLGSQLIEWLVNCGR